jgi:hypothetical protein
MRNSGGGVVPRVRRLNRLLAQRSMSQGAGERARQIRWCAGRTGLAPPISPNFPISVPHVHLSIRAEQVHLPRHTRTIDVAASAVHISSPPRLLAAVSSHLCPFPHLRSHNGLHPGSTDHPQLPHAAIQSSRGGRCIRRSLRRPQSPRSLPWPSSAGGSDSRGGRADRAAKVCRRYHHCRREGWLL